MSDRADAAEKGTIMLKINNASAYMKKIGERTESPPQQVAGIGWHVIALPSVADNVTYLSCFLEGLNEGKWSAWVDATFRPVKNNGGGFGEESSLRTELMGSEPLTDGWGWSNFVKSEELLSADSGFVADDTVEIRVDLSVTDVCGASLNVFDIPGALAADVSLKVGDSVFYANKGYLSVVSSVFRDMVTLIEAADGKKDTEEIELKDLDASEFKEFLGVVYPTRYPIIDANVISIFRIADRYDVQRIIADCERHLLRANKVPWFDKLKLAGDLRRDHLRNHLIATMTWDDVKAIEMAENRDELAKDVLLAGVERHKLLTAKLADDFMADDSVEVRADISVTDVCGASFNAFESAGVLAADVRLKVGDSVFYANKGYLSVVSSVFRDVFAFTEVAEIELKDLDTKEFKEFLGVIYPTLYPITDTNVISLFRIADRFDVKHVIADCERHLLGANCVPVFDKLKLAADLDRDDVRDTVISKMTCDDVKAIKEAEGLDQLGVDVLQALFEKHVDIHHG